ncbi:G-protein coupled receptor GRL101-like [Dendronephthya gigantea]|uniref:G-protein coupled receptor GRL101-like n=1 Tax=Dendronephthya gigantea TaxID=151771 RepID=UPI001068F74D|nr:G-protein coupled receptor GRL101-like [Dendronephthya gigantea]
MRQATIILLCVTAICSYYRTQINAENCIECESKTLFCRDKKKNSLEELLPDVNLTFIPTVKRLVLDKNNILLSKEDLNILVKNFSSLRFLDLRSNNIQDLEAFSSNLSTLKELEEIDFESNKIKEIPEDILKKMPKLSVLKLSGNVINKIPEKLLENNTELKALVLSNNKISKIEANDIKDGNKLEALLVNGNPLEDLDWPVIKKMKNLRTLNIRNIKAPNDEGFSFILNPRIFYEKTQLKFIFTSVYADCCNIKRMENLTKTKKDKNKKEWVCQFKNNDPKVKEECAVRISSGDLEDTYQGHVEVNKEGKGVWEKLKSTNWTMEDANVVCREVGHGPALEFTSANHYEKRKKQDPKIYPENIPGSHMWNRACNGSEYSILRCQKRNGGSHLFPDAGVGVRCRSLDERIDKICTERNETFDCKDKKLKNLPWQDKNDTKYKMIDLRENEIRWIQDTTSLKYFKSLETLYLSGNGLAWLHDGVFEIKSLITLDLNTNNLKFIIGELKDAQLKKQDWFKGLNNLQSLDISSNQLTSWPSNVFLPLKSIQNMSMRNNRFKEFHNRFFEHLGSLQRLDISTNPGLIILNWVELLKYLSNLKHLTTDRFTDCCFVEAILSDAECVAPADSLASCEEMIKYPALIVLMWFLVVLTIGGNIFALLMRLVKDDQNRVQNMFICSLSFSDMLMGVYLAGIINQQIATKGEYYKHDYSWRSGILCKIFGIISVISSEVSVFTLVFIAYDRFLHIVHAMEFRKIGYRTAVFLLFSTWACCTVIAVLPAMIDSYFYDNLRREGFYGTNSICMPLQLPGEDTIAWEYCLAVFGALNFIAAIYLIVSYCQMFYSSYSSAKESKNNTRLGVHTTMAKRFAAVVFTDVCCWVPIAMLLLLSLVRAINDGGNELYMWFSICVIPINSAINPILYTLSTPLFWEKVKATIKKMLFCLSQDRRNVGKSVGSDNPKLITKIKRDKKA